MSAASCVVTESLDRASSELTSIDGFVLKIAERCNINCSYCYMYNGADQSYMRRPAFMSEEIFGALLDRIDEHLSLTSKAKVTLILHGGEPLLLGVKRFEHFAVEASRRLGDRLKSLTLQTNATLIDQRWIELFKRFDIKVGVSLDGPQSLHNTFRIDHNGNGTHARTLAGLRTLQDAGIYPSVLAVVNPKVSGAGVYSYFRSLGIKDMDFLLPDVTHDTIEATYGCRAQISACDYLIPIFNDWFAENDPIVSIRLFSDIIAAILGVYRGSEAIGNAPVGYLAIDSDGSIQSNCALRICYEGACETGLNVLHHGFAMINQSTPLVAQIMQGMPLCETCTTCPERSVCGGGYVPHRYGLGNGFDNPSVWCHDLLKLISHVRYRVQESLAVTM